MKTVNFLKMTLLSVAAIAIFACAKKGNNDEQSIENAIRMQLTAYPESRLQDIYKDFYQDCFGTGHAISDTTMIFNYLRYELQNSEPSLASTLSEPLGWRHRFVRINIETVRQGMIDTAALADAFVQSASLINPSDTGNWHNEWATIIKIIEEKHLPINNYATDKLLIDSLLRENPNRAMHHSREFNAAYNPHYRVVERTLAEKLLK
ncbi:MAG: hypothetical protein LBB41_05175 [Prevotellaceae bacterium]|jgi:hypothetical protein|nr:hypothetical protein [Prevotellaceae bacterium]